VADRAIVHGLSIVESNHHIVVPLGRLSSSQPDAVFAEVGSDEGDNLFEIKLLASFEISPVL